MGLYEVPVSVSLLGFGIGTMLANFQLLLALLMTYKAVGRSIINYAAPVWSPNLHDTNNIKIQYTQNEALRIATGYHKMSSIDHLHTEAEMLKVKEHSELLSAQNLARCLEPGNVCHPITTRTMVPMKDR